MDIYGSGVATKRGKRKGKNMPGGSYPGLGLLERSIGSAYGSRTRDLRLERAASLATRRMRLTKDYIINPLLLFVKDDFGLLACWRPPKADKARHGIFCLALLALACFSSMELASALCVNQLREVHLCDNTGRLNESSFLAK